RKAIKRSSGFYLRSEVGRPIPESFRERAVAFLPSRERCRSAKLNHLVGEFNGGPIVRGLECLLGLRERGLRHVDIEAPSLRFLQRSGRLLDPRASRFHVRGLRWDHRGSPAEGRWSAGTTRVQEPDDVVSALHGDGVV